MGNVTIKDIAQICGVGVSTVSRAMNNHPDINQETKDMIMQAIEQNNYVPNNSARNLKRTDAKAIAVLVKGISNPLFNRMIKVIEQVTQKEKYELVLQHVDDNQDEVTVAIELEKEKRLRGIIFLGGYFSHSEEKLRQMSIPFVLSTISLVEEDGRQEYASVSVDDIKESYRIVNYLIQNGHKRIAVVGSRKDDESIGWLRLQGYRKALEQNHIQIDEDLICYVTGNLATYSMEAGYEMTDELLKKGKEFTALFAMSDRMAVGACKAILDHGGKIPDEYSVVGFDGMDVAQYYNPSITTIQQPVEEMAEATIRMLLDLIRKKHKSRHLVFEGQLIEGQSVRNIRENEGGANYESKWNTASDQ